MLREELLLTDEKILTNVINFWNFQLNSIYFIETGSVFAFRLEDNKGLRLFLKIFRKYKDSSSYFFLNKVGVALDKLKKIYFLEELPLFIRTKKNHYIQPIDNYIFVLYEFIEGSHPLEDFKDLNVVKLASFFNKLHSVPITEFLSISKESFDIEYMLGIQNLIYYNSLTDEYGHKMAQMLVNHQTFIDKAVKVLNRLKEKFINTNLEFVLTHGDAHHYNILQTKNQISLIDWDNIMIAPKERDLCHYYDHSNLIDNYLLLNDNYNLNHDLCLFYQIQRFLGDIRYYIEEYDLSKNQRALNTKDFLNHWGWKLSL